MTDAFFYESIGNDRFRATTRTVGPWSPAAQHGGPPSALLARALEGCSPRADARIARVTVELLGPVPVGELEVTARLVRPGRSVELVEAAMSAGGREVARASAWRIRTRSLDLEPTPAAATPSLPLPGLEARVEPAPPWVGGYLASVEWRFAHGGWDMPGPAAVWTRLTVPLVAGEPVSPLVRLLAVADCGNGVSTTFDLATWYFINPELTVHVLRPPVGEWVCVDARTAVDPGGVGLASSELSDEQGLVARGAQALLVGPRT